MDKQFLKVMQDLLEQKELLIRMYDAKINLLLEIIKELDIATYNKLLK